MFLWISVDKNNFGVKFIKVFPPKLFRKKNYLHDLKRTKKPRKKSFLKIKNKSSSKEFFKTVTDYWKKQKFVCEVKFSRSTKVKKNYLSFHHRICLLNKTLLRFVVLLRLQFWQCCFFLFSQNCSENYILPRKKVWQNNTPENGKFFFSVCLREKKKSCSQQSSWWKNCKITSTETVCAKTHSELVDFCL